MYGITLFPGSKEKRWLFSIFPNQDASDDVSGADYGWVSFWCEETQKELSCYVDAIKEEYWDETGYHNETYSDRKLHGFLEIDQYVETGIFQVQSVTIHDTAENRQHYNMWAEPEYEPDRVFPESVKNLQLHIFNTIPDITTSVANPGFIDKLESAEDNAYIVADYSGDATLTEDVFDAIAGTDKTLDLTSEGITWRFNGNDITEDIKPIDLKVDIQPMEFMDTPESEEIQEKLEEAPGVVMKFAENGTLPGKATIQVKVDYTMRNYLGSDQNLCVYYYNNQTGKLELVAENLKVVNDTYVEFSITHCSYYVLTPKLPEEVGCGYEPGDVNHDGKINAKDATLILQKSVGVLKETAKFCEICAEVSGDDKLNAKDSTLILQFSVGLRQDFPGQK